MAGFVSAVTAASTLRVPRSLWGRARESEAGRSPPAIELIGINKSFGAVHANNNVNLVVERGLIHGIVGENGAGKSTLMSILYGFYEADFRRNSRQRRAASESARRARRSATASAWCISISCWCTL